MNNQNDVTTKFLPIWVWAIVLVQVVLVMVFSVGTAMNPGDFIPGVTELNYVTQLYITRNITVALGIVAALLLRSHKALLVMLAVRFLTDLSDVTTVFVLNVEAIKSSVPMVIALLVVPALIAIGYLWGRIENDEGVS